MNCKIILLDSIDKLQNLAKNRYNIKVPIAKKTLGTIFDELARFLNLSSPKQRENYEIIYIVDNNDYYYLMAIDRNISVKYWQTGEINE